MKLVSVNVGLPREVLHKGKTATTGIFKEPVAGRVRVRRLNLDGDRQADLSVHGGPPLLGAGASGDGSSLGHVWGEFRCTRYGIAEDPNDGLFRSGEPGVQLTWMDAKIGDWVVTPRTGKAVEINALWYGGLRVMEVFAKRLGQPSEEWSGLGDRVHVGFQRFWSDVKGYCYDVLDGPDGDDDTLRPNQIFAVSLCHSPLPPEQQRGVVEACARHLLTSFGLRSVTPSHPGYRGRYIGGPGERDSAYHQGPVWGWLLGPFALAHLRVYKDPEAAVSFLTPMAHHLADYGVGSLAEIFDGDPPFTPRGCIAQAWSVAETLRAWLEIGRAARGMSVGNVPDAVIPASA